MSHGLKPSWVLSVACVVALMTGTSRAQQDPPPEAIFHHVHLNTADSAKVLNFYLNTFGGMNYVHMAGFEGVESPVQGGGQMYFLFTKVPRSPAICRAEELHPSRLDGPVGCTEETTLWHWGLHVPDRDERYRRLLTEGAKFPMHPLPFRGGTGPGPSLLQTPAGDMIEFNPGENGFSHVHIQSEHPICAANWWEKHIGGKKGPLPPSAEKDCRLPIDPPDDDLISTPATQIFFGKVRFGFAPQQRPGKLKPTLGSLGDHIALTVPDVSIAVARLRKMGVKVIKDVHNFGSSKIKAVMIEGPDQMAIELLERVTP